MKFVVFHMPNIKVLHVEFLSTFSIKLYLLAFEVARLSSPEKQLIFIPVVQDKLLLS